MDKRFPIEDQIEMLAASLRGRIVTPTHDSYDATRALAAANYDTRPAALIRVANAADVAAVINFAQATGLELAIRSGGHSSFGGSNGGLVIDLRDLNRIEIDVVARTAWCGTGLTAGEVTHAVEQHGLIVGFGDTASVGIGGLTTGGGIGYLVRKHGLTIDSVVAAEVVTANGDIVIADAEHHTDLFWAVRGGGGNFGVVTRWKYKLHPLPEFTGGPLVLPATPEVVAGFVAAAEAAPEELSAIATVMRAPPMPFLPPNLHGQVVFMCMMAFAGSPEAARAALAPFRALATPYADLVGPAPYSSLYMPEDPSAPAPSFAVRSRLTDTFGVEEAQLLIDRVSQSDAMLPLGEIRVLGGAMARVPADATAFAHRNARYQVSFIAVLDNPADVPGQANWAQSGIEAIRRGEDRVYVNFIVGDKADRRGAAWPQATWERLRRIKRAYDPDNLFRLNQNIPPA
jgi:FAD/FMN-containing dehydrogenase